MTQLLKSLLTVVPCGGIPAYKSEDSSVSRNSYSIPPSPRLQMVFLVRNDVSIQAGPTNARVIASVSDHASVLRMNEISHDPRLATPPENRFKQIYEMVIILQAKLQIKIILLIKATRNVIKLLLGCILLGR